MVVRRPFVLERLKSPAEVGVLREHRQERGADLLHGHRGAAAALDNGGKAPGDAVGAECRRQLDEAARLLRPERHVHGRIHVVADLHPLAALRHRVEVKDLAAQAGPEQVLGIDCFCVAVGHARHHPVARQGCLPLRSRGFAIDGFTDNRQRLMRRDLAHGDVAGAQCRCDARDEGVVPGRHDLAAKIVFLAAAGEGAFFHHGDLFLADLLALLLGQHRLAGPQHEIGRLPAHHARPELLPLIEDIGQFQPDLAGHFATGADIGLVDMHPGRLGVRDVETDDGVAALLQRTGQIDPLAHGDALDVGAGGHAAHAVQPQPGHVVALLGDERIAVRRLDVAERRQRLLEHERQIGQRPAEIIQDHAAAPLGVRMPASAAG